MMSNLEEKEVSYSYYIDLPIDEALYVRDGLEAAIWDVAKDEGIESILREAKFEIRASEPAIDAGVVITVVITYVATKAVDKITDKVMDKIFERTEEALKNIWLNKILPRIRQRFGSNVLVDESLPPSQDMSQRIF